LVHQSTSFNTQSTLHGSAVEVQELLFETGIPVCRSIAENAAQNPVKFASGDQA
jgi:hypothetical protein